MTMMRIFALSSALVLAGCTVEKDTEEPDGSPAEQWFASLSQHCGKAFAGSLVSDQPVDADFKGAAMVMHVKECADERIAIPFHVELANDDGTRAWDRSRTWVITKQGEALRLKHDHRHEDGSEDTLTQYGGDTVEAGSPSAQHFIVDQDSIDLFEREGLDASTKNVWTVEVDDAQYAYQLKRTVAGGAPEERLFRVEFDLSKEVGAPPSAWGHE